MTVGVIPKSPLSSSDTHILFPTIHALTTRPLIMIPRLLQASAKVSPVNGAVIGRATAHFWGFLSQNQFLQRGNYLACHMGQVLGCNCTQLHVGGSEI